MPTNDLTRDKQVASCRMIVLGLKDPSGFVRAIASTRPEGGTMTKRDPRKDPEPGDVVVKRGVCSRKVVAATCGNVKYRLLNPGVDHDVYGIMFHASWQRWAKGAEVMHVAED